MGKLDRVTNNKGSTGTYIRISLEDFHLVSIHYQPRYQHDHLLGLGEEKSHLVIDYDFINKYIYDSVLMGMRYNGSRYSMLHGARVGVVHPRETNKTNAFDRNFGWRSGIRGGKYAGEAQDRSGVCLILRTNSVTYAIYMTIVQP